MNFRNLVKKSLNIIFPSQCLGCGTDTMDGRLICGECFARIPVYQNFFCGRCRARRPAPEAIGYGGQARLPNAKKICHNDFPFLLASATDYNEPVKSLIHTLKFRKIRGAAKPLGEILVNYAIKSGFDFSDFSVIPVPLHAARQRERGFNQAELLAEIFAEYFSLPLNNRVLARERKTKAQSELKNFEDRKKNVENCFAVADANATRGKNIILVDDVITSGSTILAAATALKNAGARKIIAMATAKAWN